jgi:hypothetical protein
MKNNFLSKIIILSALLAMLYSCTERIDIELEEGYARLSVESYFYEEADSGYVRLTKTAGYFSNVPAERISKATVMVEVNDRLYTLYESETEKGYYLTPTDFTVETNESLHLSIDLNEAINSETHFEAETYMPPISDQIDSINILYREDFDFWIIKLYALDPPGANYYMFDVLRNDTLITDSISEVFVTDDRLVDNMYINGVYVNFLPGDQLHPGDKVTLITSSITKEYYEYVIELQTEINFKDPIFSGPPANVSTNISNGAVGYFVAYPSTFTDYIIPEDFLNK